jgi:hypothetical protein
VALVSASMVMGLPMIVGAHTYDEVQTALDWASSSVESYCEREFGWRNSDTVTLDPYFGHVKAMSAIPPMSAYASYPGYGVSYSSFGSPYIGQTMLPNPPVINVSSVLAFMPMTNGGDMGWVALSNYQFAEDGLVWDTTGMPGVEMSDGGPVPSWPRAPRSLQITYDHGYALPEGGAPSDAPPLPQGVIDAVIRGAALYLDNPTGAMENRVGEITNRYDATGPAGWLDEKLLGRYRLVNI